MTYERITTDPAVMGGQPLHEHSHLSFAAMGESSSGHGASEADEMLAEGFGRD